jgi:hypothetical protein
VSSPAPPVRVEEDVLAVTDALISLLWNEVRPDTVICKSAVLRKPSPL